MKIRERIIRIKTVDTDLKDDLKDPVFRRLYEWERLKLSIGVQINQIRRKKRLSYKRLAKKAGVSQKLLLDIEKGDRDNLTIESLRKIALAMDRTLDIHFREV